LAALLGAGAAAAAPPQPADQAALFKEASAREAALRRELAAAHPGTATAIQRRVRPLVGAFEDLAQLFPGSGQADKALWQGASLSADLFLRFGDELDRDRALRMLSSLSEGFPGSAYARQAAPLEHRLREARPAPAAAPAAAAAPPSTTRAVAPRTAPAAIDASPRQPRESAVSRAPAAAPGAPREPALVTLAAVRRERLPDAVRVTIELDREVPYYSERIPGPDRVFVDLPRTRAVPTLEAAVVPFAEDVVRRVRVGAQPGPATRVVLDLDKSGRHSVYTLYNPYRIVIDVERARPDAGRAPPARPAAKPALVAIAPPVPAAPSVSTPVSPPAAPVPVPATAAAVAADSAEPSGPLVAVAEPPPPPPPADVRPASSRRRPERTVAARAASAAAILAAPSSPALDAAPPAVPAVNTRGGFSLARQLGLGVARVVIDAGHGGHDPGARGKGLSEADLTLDIALRLEKLLLRQPGVEVVQTRRTNAYVALEERTEHRQPVGCRPVPVDSRQRERRRARPWRGDLFPELCAQSRGRGDRRARERRIGSARCDSCPTCSAPSPSTTSSTSRATLPKWCSRRSTPRYASRTSARGISA
jgi:N-acetylmuramoyl-L-alanine amidase